ncbi:molybdopterin synthase catalytic subunit [Gammaproteobacteria bacterium]
MSVLIPEIRVQDQPFDPWVEQARLQAKDGGAGALVAFVGTLRDFNEGIRVTAMTLEHYPGMTERTLEAIAQEAARRWVLRGIRIIHRVGCLRPMDPIVLVAVTAVHRGDAFRACEFLIDFLKTQAPFWKKEATESGERWLEARASDADARDRWD